MGLIKAFVGAVGGGLADQWLEAIEPMDMSEGVVLTKGVFVRRDDARSSNTKGTQDIINNGSLTPCSADDASGPHAVGRRGAGEQPRLLPPLGGVGTRAS